MRAMKKKFFRAGKCVFAITCIFFVSWLATVTEWSQDDEREAYVRHSLSTMKTIVAYSAGKREEMDRPSLVTCEQLPSYPRIPYWNGTWPQPPGCGTSWQRVPGTDVQLYAAYYDPRSTRPHIRILATFRGRKWGARPPLYCQTRPKNPAETTVEVVAAKILEIWRDEWDSTAVDIDTPLLLSCSLTEDLTELSIISVVQEPCHDPQNAFMIKPFQFSGTYKRNFTVCVKDMRFGDSKIQNIIEWIEVSKLLGAECIDMYVDEVSENLKIVLEKYKEEGIVRLFTAPTQQSERSLWQRRRDHIVSYNDCLYRNIEESKFILPIDIDEVFLPKVANDWKGLLERLEALDWDQNVHSSIMVKNVFFFEFMQEKSEHRNVNTSKPYAKRDDVRINRTDILKSNKLNCKKVIDIEKENRYSDLYIKRCGREIPKSTVLSHRIRSSLVSPMGEFSKSMMLTRKVLTAFNHYPLDNIGAEVFGGWSAPFHEVQMNHYKSECNASLVWDCARYAVRGRSDCAAARLGARVLRALSAAPCLPAPPHTHNTINNAE